MYVYTYVSILHMLFLLENMEYIDFYANAFRIFIKQYTDNILFFVREKNKNALSEIPEMQINTRQHLNTVK